MRKFGKKCLAVLLLALFFGVSAWAADENITDWLRQTLRDEVASVALYNPTESLSRYGELVYNEKSGSVELTISAEDVSELTDIARMDSAPRRGDEPEDEPEDEPDGQNEPPEELPVVPAGYVLVRVSTANRESVSLCIAEEYAISPEERAARKAAEHAAAEAPETPEGESPAEESPDGEAPAEEAEAVPTPEPVMSTPELPASLARSRAERLSARELLFLIAALVVLLIAVAELGIILRERNRAENVAKNYIRTRAALDKTKRELTAAKSKSVRLERELLEEQNRMSAIKKQFERMGGRSKAESAAPQPKAADSRPAPKTNGLPDLDYLDWMK